MLAHHYNHQFRGTATYLQKDDSVEPVIPKYRKLARGRAHRNYSFHGIVTMLFTNSDEPNISTRIERRDGSWQDCKAVSRNGT